MEIANYREQPPGNALVALFDAVLGQSGMTFRNLKLIRSKKGNLFIAFAGFVESEDGFGKKTYGQYITFTPEKGNEFQKAALEALEPYLRR